MDHRHSKRHSSASAGRRDVPTTSCNPAAMLHAPGTSTIRPLTSAPANDGPLTTVNEEDSIDGIGDMTFTLTSKHLLATTDSRSSYHRTKDLSAYETLCQNKSSSRVPSPYHAMESLVVQNVKPATGMFSEIGSEDTGYKSTSSGSFASREMHVRSRKSGDLQGAKHRERVETMQRIPTQNPRPPPDPSTLAALLIEKLEQVRRDQGQSSSQDNHYRSREDLEKEDAQSILDDHITRVFGDSPGELSPREKVSSWVMGATRYYDLPVDDGKFSSHRGSSNSVPGLLPMEASDVGGHHYGRQQRRHHGLGSMDEGLGRSINSLSNSTSGMEQQQTRSSLNPLTSDDLLRNSHSSSNQGQSKFSNWFTLKPSKKLASAVTTSVSTQAVSNCTRETISVVYQIVGEALPYLSKVAGSQLTLKQFKSLIPRKGKYRYFFKRMCEELDVGAVFEEIVDDNETLPFWEGKISSRLEPIVD